MFFDHTYHIKSEMKLSGGDVVKIKTSVEARFVTERQIINAVKERIEFETGEKVVEILSFKAI
jgi:hypothetical protein